MTKITKILPTDLIAVDIPKECDDYEIVRSQDNFNLRQLHYQSDFWNGLPNYDFINLGEYNFEILGEATADKVSFDVASYVRIKGELLPAEIWAVEKIYHSRFRNILQSKGLYFFNPKGVNPWGWKRLKNESFEEWNQKCNDWKEAESKVIKGKLVIIKKV